METIRAIFLAIIQGITEFLPVSSSAHLILAPKLLGWEDQGLAFDVAVHVGTLLAVIIFLRHEIAKIIPAWLGGFKGLVWNEWGRLGWWVVLATLPVALAGLLGKNLIEQHLREPWVIASATALFAILLLYADKNASQNQRDLAKMTLIHALIFIGVAQAFALIPGTSRSGVTMTMALFLGYKREAAAKFSFLLAVPTILFGGLFAAKDVVEQSAQYQWMPLIIGTLVSAVFALLCMRWFMNFLQTVGMRPFVYYRFLLAIVIVLVFYV